MKKVSPKKLNKLTIPEIAQNLDKLIEKGINISIHAKEDTAIYSNDDPVDWIHGLHKEYLLWTEGIKKLLNRKKVVKKIDIGVLYEGNSVPFTFGGSEYGDVRSEEYQKLIRNVRVEVKRKLKWLRGVERKLSKKSVKDNKNTFPYRLSAGTHWGNFIIKFKDDENVFVRVKERKHNADYKDMGMVGRGKNPGPSEAWTLLKVLAQMNGELTIENPKAKYKYKKQKEILSTALRNYFTLEYDPFYPYHSSSEKSGDSYRIKITLIPPPNQKEKVDADEDKDDDLGVKEYLEEQTSQAHGGR